MKISFFTFTLLLAVQTSFGQTKYSKICKNGIFNGHYESTYANGRMKAQGDFVDNQRVGEWKVWDSLGNLRMTRNYTNNTDFNISTAYNTQNELVSVTPSAQHSRIKNDQGFYEYPKVANSDVIWSQRIWREIGKTEMNSLLFKDNRLFNILLSHVTDKTLNGFKGNSDQLTEPLNEPDIVYLKQKTDYEVIGFAIKEDWFYDKRRQVLDVQIVGICPIILFNNEPTNLFWVYFPQAKAFLTANTTDLVSLDDFFFVRKFNSSIIKQSNMHDRNVDTYTSIDQLTDEIERIEIGIIEQEHTQWIESTVTK